MESDIANLIIIYKNLESVINLTIPFEISPSVIIEIYQLVSNLTKTYDESHDINHHVKVFVNAISILKKMKAHNFFTDYNYNRLVTMIIFASLLHDAIDSKYPTDLEMKKKEVANFLYAKCSADFHNIQWIIDNISYSKEKKNGYPVQYDPVVQFARDIVSDADKLEAIGEVGIYRCRKFSEAQNPNLSSDEIEKLVVEHCHDKLLKLKDFYIRTGPGKDFAHMLHNQIVDYVNKNQQKN